jgi:hypothetical protein
MVYYICTGKKTLLMSERGNHMKTLKLLSLVLSVLLLMTALLACGEEAAEPAAEDTTAAETTTVEETEPPIETELKVNKAIKVLAGAEGEITARLKIDPSKEATLTIASSDENVALSAEASGVPGDDGKLAIKIKGVALGKAVITVTTSDGVTAETEISVYEEQIIKEIVFTDPEFKYFRGYHSLAPGKVENGVYITDITGGDPFMEYHDKKMGLAADDIGIIRFYFKSTAGDGSMQLFFLTDTVTGYNESASLKTTAETGTADFEICDFDTSESPDWTGVFNAFRIDPSSADSGNVQFQKIEFIKRVEG